MAKRKAKARAAPKAKTCTCPDGRGWGLALLILGLLIIANKQWAVLSWSMFAGTIIGLVGLWNLIKPSR